MSLETPEKFITYHKSSKAIDSHLKYGFFSSLRSRRWPSKPATDTSNWRSRHLPRVCIWSMDTNTSAQYQHFARHLHVPCLWNNLNHFISPHPSQF